MVKYITVFPYNEIACSGGEKKKKNSGSLFISGFLKVGAASALELLGGACSNRWAPSQAS